MIKNTKLFIFGAVALVIGIAVLYFSMISPNKSIDVSQGKINKVETMAQLCAIEIYSEVPVLDTINNKVMFAVQKQKGSVSFDLENMEMDTKGDTVCVFLI